MDFWPTATNEQEVIADKLSPEIYIACCIGYKNCGRLGGEIGAGFKGLSMEKVRQKKQKNIFSGSEMNK